MVSKAFHQPTWRIAGSSNGRTLGSGPSNLGSSPNPAALVLHFAQCPSSGEINTTPVQKVVATHERREVALRTAPFIGGDKQEPPLKGAVLRAQEVHAEEVFGVVG